MYTYVDADHCGESCLAANWEAVGVTTGRIARDGRPEAGSGPCAGPFLARGFVQASLRRFAPCLDIRVADDAHRADVEYGSSTHPDGRLTKRILSMGRDWQRDPGQPVPRMFPS